MTKQQVIEVLARDVKVGHRIRWCADEWGVVSLAERLQDDELAAALEVLDEEIERLTVRALACAFERERIALRLILVKETARATLERQRATPAERERQERDLTEELTRLASKGRAA